MFTSLPRRLGLPLAALTAGLVAAGATAAAHALAPEALSASAASGESRAAPAAPSAVAELFAAVPGTESALLVVTGPASDAETRVRAYVCQGRKGGIAEWFSGSARGGTFDLTSAYGGDARLQGRLTASGISATLTPADGTPRRLAAKRARGFAGLYLLDLARDGTIRARSERGNRLVGHLYRRTGQMFGTFTARSGTVRLYRSRKAPGPQPARQYLVIFSPAGDQYGFPLKVSARPDLGVDTFIDWEGDL